jgi:hypothetical protein
MIPVGSISDTEGIIKASLSHIHHDRAAAFKLSERSPLPPAVIARLHVTCPGPGNTRIIYCLLARSVRSPAIILPLYNSKILTSTCATVSTDIASYEAIHGRMPLHFMNYPFPTPHDTQSTRNMSFRFENTDCTSEVS